jgi:cyclopropane fatty-acyl-phospholipid synthase-like methyltransferase
METKRPDAVEFRDGQRQQWNSAATGWRKWSELIDGAASGVSERLVDLAGVEPGSRVLDVAAGYGEPSLTAARRTGAEGSVVAIDISAEMIAPHPQEVQDEAWAAITEAMREVTTDAGKVRLSNLVLLAAGRA